MLPRGEVIPGVRKIAVLRASVLGDFIFALPALEGLRAAYPHVEIVLLSREWHRRFLAGRPAPVDRVIPVPLSKGVNEDAGAGDAEDPAELEQFFSLMQQEAFDIAIQMHGGGRHSNPFVLRLGARLTVGLRTPDAAPLDRWIPYSYWQNEILRNLEIVSLLGVQPLSIEPRLAVTAADQAEALQVVPELASEQVAVLHPGAGDQRRRWPPQKFAAVGEALAAAGARVVVTGSRPDEQPAVEQVIAGMQARAENLWGRLSLGGLAGLLSLSSLAISNDSGPLHMAQAVGAATVGIYWCGNMINAGPASRARHRPAISWRLNCLVCNKNCMEESCEHDASFVADVPVDEVIASALDLLAAQQPAPIAGTKR